MVDSPKTVQLTSGMSTQQGLGTPSGVRPHFIAGCASLALILVALIVGRTYADAVEARYIHTLAPLMFDQKNQGSALQVEAFRQQDLLPVYGSSELTFPDPYSASALFRRYPSGFTIFPVGTADTEPLNMIQKLAAVGPDVRGKKLVISLSPSFYYEGMYHSETYAGNYSPLHANALAFSTALSLGVKRDVAKRMLDYPATLEKDALLNFALGQLADGSPQRMFLYYLTLPLGEVHLFILNLQDHWESLDVIAHRPGLRLDVPRETKTLDWVSLAAEAESAYRKHSNNNPFGMDNDQWLYYREDVLKGENSTSDERFLNLVANSKGWGDLDLLLLGLEDLGANPLIIALPINGGYFDFQGISYNARKVLYDRLDAAISAHGIQSVILDAYDEDKYFLIDPGAHLSSKGWVFYDRALDAFYHGAVQ